MKFHLEVLPRSTRKQFNWIQQQPFISDFYLAGGMALALYYGHRQSVDLDFFSRTEFNASHLKKQLSPAGQWTGLKQEWHTLVGRVDKTKVSFFTIEDKLLRPLIPLQQLRLADPLDIAVMKIIAISDRGTKRDFIDLYILAHQLMPLPQLFSYLPKKYGAYNFNPQHIIRSLGYFGDAEADAMPKMLTPIAWRAVQKFFDSAAKDLAKSFLGD